jgi:hypothetical protein
VQSVPRFIATSIHAKARNTVTNEEIPVPLLDLEGSPCRLFKLPSPSGARGWGSGELKSKEMKTLLIK